MNPKDIVWQMMRDIQKQLENLEVLINEYAFDLDDGYDWIQQEKVEEE